MKFPQRLPTALFCFGIVFFPVGHRETLVDKLARFFFPSRLGVNSTELNVVHQTVWIERDRFLHCLFSLLVRSLWQLAINHPGHQSFRRTDLCQYAIPSAKNMPGGIVVR